MDNFKQLLDVLSGALTPVIAILATYIALQQYKIQRRQYLHDLYERRLTVYRGLVEFLWTIMCDARINYTQINEFSNKTAEAIFLFDRETTDHLDLIQKKAGELRNMENMLYPVNGKDGLPVGEKRTKVAEAKGALLKWFDAQMKKSEELFKRKMGLVK